MKKILSLALAAIFTLGVSMSAATLSSKSTDAPTAKSEKKEMKGDRAKRNKGPKFNPFEGLNLTDQQKEALKALRPSKGEKAASCCNTDSTACKADNKKCSKLTAEQRKQHATETLAKIKAILTPEQYQQYLENVAVSQFMKGGKMKGDKNRQGKRPGHDKKQGKKGPRGERGQKPQQAQPQNS